MKDTAKWDQEPLGKAKQESPHCTDSCAVCGDRATKYRYSHYGTTSCFSCRAFYRRCVSKDSHLYFSCQGDSSSQCQMNINTRKKCQKCRFQKCRQVGMTYIKGARDLDFSPSNWSRPEPITSSTKLGLRRKCRASLSSASSHIGSRGLVKEIQEIQEEVEAEKEARQIVWPLVALQPASSSLPAWEGGIPRREGGRHPLPIWEGGKLLPPSPSMGFTKEERTRVQRLLELDQSIVISFNDLEQEVAEKVLGEMYSRAFSSQPMDYQLIFWGYTFAIKKLTWFAQAIQEFSSCQIDDKKELLLQNLDPMFNIKSAFFFLSQSSCLLEQLQNLCVFDTQHLSIANARTAPPLKWNQFFSTPWATNVEHENKYEQLLEEAKKLDLDEKSGCLLKVVALFASDNSILAARSQVEETQDGFCLLLYRFLVDRDGSDIATERYPQYISMLSHLREMADIMRNHTLKL